MTGLKSLSYFFSRQLSYASFQCVKVLRSLSLFFRETKKEGGPPQVVGGTKNIELPQKSDFSIFGAGDRT